MIRRRNPLTGLSGLQPGEASTPRAAMAPFRSQSPYGAKWFATWWSRRTPSSRGLASQSPYGAKWFATKDVRAMAHFFGRYRRNPLTGLSGLQLIRVSIQESPYDFWSQSPYGAKWFATRLVRCLSSWGYLKSVAIPLRG